MPRPRLRRSVIALVAALSAGGCTIGPSEHTFRAGLGPAGAETTVEPRGAPRIIGELLAVDDTSFVLLTTGLRVTIVPYRHIESAILAQMGTQIADGLAPPPAQREKLARVARYPQGIAPDLMSALLAAYGQERPEVFAP